MKKKHCPCCNSTLRSKKKKKKVAKLFFFVTLFSCSLCYTEYAWIKLINKSLCIKPGITLPEKINETAL